MMAMLDPFKADVHTTALLALVKMGKPASDRAVKLLKDDDEKLKTHSLAKIQKFTKAKKPPKNKPYLETAAIMLGTMGRSDTIKPMLEVINQRGDEGSPESPVHAGADEDPGHGRVEDRLQGVLRGREARHAPRRRLRARRS